jgi:hypothetical protein
VTFGQKNMNVCWAACLGNCSDKMSREHIVTKAIYLDNEVTVSGMPWCANEPKKVGLASLTAKVLCVFHNSALSEIDQAALGFAEAMRESFRLLQVRIGCNDHRWRIEKFPIDGYQLERWLLKTLINAAYNRGSPIGPDSVEVGLPSKSLVEIAFGKKRFEPNAGLYGIYDEAENRPRYDGVDILTFNTQANHVLGAVFSFLGFRLLLYLDTKGPTLPFMEIVTPTGEKAQIIEPTYHPKRIEYGAGTGISHSVDFKWPTVGKC